MSLTQEEEKDLAEAVLRTRRWSFRQAYPEILRTVRQIVARHDARREERSHAADRMIRDYRAIISSLEDQPVGAPAGLTLTE